MAEDSGALTSLNDQLLASIFFHVCPKDVASVRAVSKEWEKLVDEAQVAKEVFKRTWGLSEVTGQPRKASFYTSCVPSNFVVQHRCRHWESLTSIAVQYNVDVTAIRVLNNLITDHSLRSRQAVYVPVLPAHIAGKAAQLTYDATADRDLVVLANDAASLPEPPPLSPKQAQERADDIACKMSTLMSKSLRIDEATAKFYLKDAGGDLKAAIRLAEDDARWEQLSRRCGAAMRCSR